jgi:hypothetical protein
VSKSTVRFLVSLPIALVALFFMLRPDSRATAQPNHPVLPPMNRGKRFPTSRFAELL